MPISNQNITDNIFSTIYSTFDHNNLVIAYVAAAFLAALLVFRRPNRFHLLLLFGFSLLAFNYEYEKHLIAPLRDQTLKALAPNPAVHIKTQYYTEIFLSVLVPIGLYSIGWGLLFWAMISGGKQVGKKNSSI
jgi:hypothetical protein